LPIDFLKLLLEDMEDTDSASETDFDLFMFKPEDFLNTVYLENG